MPRQSFERDLRRLQDDVLVLGSMVASYLNEAVESLKRRDLEAASRLVDWDSQVNEKRFAIENSTLGLIATQQPMASDLRTLAAVLEIITDLERIGDYAKGIAKINLMIGEEPLIKPLVDLPRMAEKAVDMLQRALQAFVQQDVDLARAIPEEDDVVDELYNRVYRDLLGLIIKDTRVIDQSTHLLWAAHNLERTADRVVNICERVVFTVTGQMIEMNHGSKVQQRVKQA
jgi:phosphate transport system protein